jgi:hypothetical protein
MTKILRGAAILILAACGNSHGDKPAPAPGGSGGSGGAGGSGGTVTPPYGGSGGGGSGGSTPAPGGSGGSGGEGGGSPAVDSGPATPPGDGPPAAALPGSPIPGWYEAEAMPPNEKAPKSEVHVTAARACKTTPPNPGDDCNSGGGQVTWITQGRQGWLQFNQVMAASDGMYDVTWWYHCGNNDNFGDKHCGGQTNPPTTAAGCRPHNLIVNGTELVGTYHFPCFAGSFGIIRAATTALPLKAGANTIRVYPKSRDSADMDAIWIQPAGKGVEPHIMSNNVSGVN